MNEYFVCIELIDAPDEKYKELDAMMSVNGYSRTATDLIGTARRLPRGVYFGLGPAIPAFASSNMNDLIEASVWPRVNVLANSVAEWAVTWH